VGPNREGREARVGDGNAGPRDLCQGFVFGELAGRMSRNMMGTAGEDRGLVVYYRISHINGR